MFPGKRKINIFPMHVVYVHSKNPMDNKTRSGRSIIIMSLKRKPINANHNDPSNCNLNTMNMTKQLKIYFNETLKQEIYFHLKGSVLNYQMKYLDLNSHL